MPHWAYFAATALLVVLTLLPLSRHEAWWVRDLDFPRLQLSTLALVLLLVEAVTLDWSSTASWLLAAAAVGCVLLQMWWIAPYVPVYPREVSSIRPGKDYERLRIMAVNVLTPNRNADRLLDIIRANRPDILIAVETDRWWESRLDALEPEMPHALKRPQDNLYGMHLYSRFPLEDPAIQYLVEDDIPSMHAAIALPSGKRIRLHCLHPKPPSPTENSESSERDAELIAVGKSVAKSDLPVIVAGDLNDVAWSATTRLFRKISGLLDPRVGRGMFNTFHAKYPILRWPLDHLFHSRHFAVVELKRLPAFGSDHFPILIELALADEPASAGKGLEAEAEDRRFAEEKTADEPVSEADVHTPGE